MRVNVYAEEMTDRFEIFEKTIEGETFTALRMYLAFPGADGKPQFFIHRPGDDDSSAVTFWGKKDLRTFLLNALAALDQHHGA